MSKSVVVFTQPGCVFCDRVKEFLRQRGVAYTEKDISRDDAAYTELTDRGFYATPVTMIDGDAVVGFNKPRLEQALGS